MILHTQNFNKAIDPDFVQPLKEATGVWLEAGLPNRLTHAYLGTLVEKELYGVLARGGVIGAVCDAWMLQPGWIVGHSTNESVTLDTVVDHIDYVCQVAGSSRHAAIGSDLDGGFGREQSPRDLDTIADLQRLSDLLATRGYADDDIAAIMHGNWLRLLRQSWTS